MIEQHPMPNGRSVASIKMNSEVLKVRFGLGYFIEQCLYYLPARFYLHWIWMGCFQLQKHCIVIHRLY